jgi:hypothetical protein
MRPGRLCVCLMMLGSLRLCLAGLSLLPINQAALARIPDLK